MKFSSATILAILASSACVSAAPAIVAEQTMVKREDVNEVLNLIAEIKKINAKRDYAEGEDLLDLERRADSAIGELISALANSGIISLVWNKLTTDSGISSAISAIIKSAIQTAVVQGPALIQAVWNSGLLGDVFNLLLNDTDLRQALLDVAKSIFSTAANLVASWVSGGSSSSSGTTTAAAAAPAASGASKREIMELDAEYLSERDLSSIISWIVQEIKDSGIVQSLVNQVINNPEQVISFLTSAFQTGLVVAEDIYSWAKQAGLWDSALSYIEANAGSWAGAIASFLGNALANGSVSASEIDNAGTLSNTATTVAPITTAAPLAAASPATTTASSAPAAAAAAPLAASPAAASSAPAAAAAASASTPSGSTGTSGNNDALNSLIAKYGGSTASSTPQVDTSGLGSDVNSLVNAAGQAASSLKKRKLY